MPHFTVLFLSAYLVWTFFSQATLWSTSRLVGYRGLEDSHPHVHYVGSDSARLPADRHPAD